MALVAHTIISRYTPQQREPTAQPAVPEDDPWQTESSFGPAQRLYSRPAPYFVAASLEYDEYGMPRSDGTARPEDPKRADAAEGVSAWYRSLTSRGRFQQEEDELSQPSSSTLTSSPHCPSHCTTPEPQLLSSRPQSTPPRRTTTNWFTYPKMTDASGPLLTHISKPSAFADLLSRNPPPLGSDPAFKPPIFLALGPGNKGFTMLQRKGWQEGEGLGSSRVERRPRAGLGIERNGQRTHDVEEHKSILRRLQRSEHATTPLITEATREVIDLTLSDSEAYEDHEVVDLTLSDSQCESDSEPGDTDELSETLEHLNPRSHGTTLLTPIATTLKADRLGIGFKARRHSSTSKGKAVTHTSSALAAHIRSAKQMRKEKARHGRGSRGFARSKRKEERERVRMLAYMNS